MKMDDSELEAAVNEAIANGPLPHEIHWAKMSTYFLRHVVDYFEGDGRKELHHAESREAYTNAKAALRDRAES